MVGEAPGVSMRSTSLGKWALKCPVPRISLETSIATVDGPAKSDKPPREDGFSTQRKSGDVDQRPINC